MPGTHPGTHYDFIVIGAGSAGCVVASRLSERQDCTVLLIEAGESDRNFLLKLKTELPVGNVFLLSDPRYNWGDKFVTGANDLDRTVICPRGRMFGGCSSVNGTVYMRGVPKDYDRWHDLGNDGWRWTDVLPAFKAHENRAGGGDLHGQGGALDVAKLRDPNPISLAFVDAARQAGHLANDDFNGLHQDGFGLFDVNQRGGKRLSAARAFLAPAMKRANLHVLDRTTVDRLLIEDGRAVGVACRRDGERFDVRAREEIVLSGGTVNSPHLLMLSGVGPAADLRRHGVDVVRDLPGVGQNLHDHPAVIVSCEDSSGKSFAITRRSLPRYAFAVLQYLVAGRGALTSNVAEAGGFLRTVPGLDAPDVQVTFLAGLKGNATFLPNRHGFQAIVNACRPRSRGRIELRSGNSEDRPVLRMNFLAADADRDTLVRGVKAVRHVLSQPALDAFRGAEITPGPGVRSDEDIAAFVHDTVATVYHPVGTCRMGPDDDPAAVVDSRLQVRGVAGLRIADASIMPEIVAGNTSAPAMMIGERAAAFILDDLRAMRAAG